MAKMSSNRSSEGTVESYAKLPLQSTVLCVDLDGTFLKADTLVECFIEAIRNRPSVLLFVPIWLAHGRFYFKEALAHRVGRELDFKLCPRDHAVERFIAEARAHGATIELISAAEHRMIVDRPEFDDLFDAVIGSSDGVNLKGHAKAEFLCTRHPSGFAYVGNSAADLPVWRIAKERFGVNLRPLVRYRAKLEGLDLVELARAKPLLPALLEAMRLHQWLKNLLVFVPLGLIVMEAGWSDLLTFVAGFLLFGLLASGTYLANDIMDMEADRGHPTKRYRPIPSGDLSVPLATLASFGLIVAALFGAYLLSLTFALTLVGYLLLTLSYSIFFKRLPLIDVLVIAGLFTLRIVAGMVLIGQSPSEWLLMFAIFFFVSLALMKREVELRLTAETGGESLRGRGYALEDRLFVFAFGVSSGVAALVVFALFVSAMGHESQSAYATPALLWGALATLSYWVMRMWLLTARGLMHDDPILHAAREPASLILGALTALFVGMAQLLHL